MSILIGLLGLTVGWGINQAANSLPGARRLRPPRCQACGAPLPPRAWIAWIALAIRAWSCVYCSAPRRWREPLVELAGAAGALWVFTQRPDPSQFAAAMLVFGAFLLVLVIDLEHRLIPHLVTLPSAVILGLIGILDPARGPAKTLVGGLVGFVFFFLLYLLGSQFARLVARWRGRPLDEIAFGFGDVTLAGVIGLAVGWPGVLVALVLGIMAAGVFSLGYLLVMLLRGRYTAFLPIPYGPFMILGAWLVYFGGRTALERLLYG